MQRLIAWVRLMRLYPTFTWVGASLTVGVSIAARHSGWQNINYRPVLLVACGGVICHGLLSHSLNDYVDWISGTDQYSPGLFSGGSRVVPDGYLHLHHLKRGASVGLVAGSGIMAMLTLSAGRAALFGGGLASLAAVCYSMPPIMLAYRPLLGEWLCALPALSACAWLASQAATGGLTLPLHEWQLIFSSSLAFVAHLMFHHLSDIESDIAATPQKLTTPAYVSYNLQWDPRIIPMFYWAIIVVISLSAKMRHLAFSSLLFIIVTACVDITERKLLAKVDKLIFSFTAIAIILEALF